MSTSTLPWPWKRLLFLLSVFLNACSMATSSSILAWNDPTLRDHHNEVENLSGLLTARPGSELRTLVNAKRIIKDLSSSPSCAYLPTARLLQQCKLIKPKTQDAAADQQKANVQANYGISMALCEAQQARISTPPACAVFETLLERHVSDTSVEIVRRADIESCMNSLFNTASWTSYITYRAQSNDLCDSSRADYQREELLETFRSATKIVPEVLEALQEQQQEAYFMMAGVREMSAEIAQSQQDVVTANQEQAIASKEHLRQMSDYMETYMQVMKESGKSWQDNLKQGIEHASKDLAVMRDKASDMQINFAELYASAAEAVSGMTYNLEVNVDLMTKQVGLLAGQLFDVKVDEHIESIQQAMAVGHAAATDFASIQSQQAQYSEAQLNASHDLLQIIKDSHGQFRHIKETLDLIPDSWIDTLHHIRALATHVRDEAKYALMFTAPSLLLLLFGRSRLSLIMVLIYAFMRSSLSIARSMHFTFATIPITLEDLKLLGICLLGAIVAGATVALVGSFLLSLLVRRKRPSKVADAEEGPVRLSEKTTNTAAVQTLPRSMQSRTKTPDRSSRASTAPP